MTLYTGKAVLPDGREVTAKGTMQEMANWVANLICLHGNIDCTITEVKT